MSRRSLRALALSVVATLGLTLGVSEAAFADDVQLLHVDTADSSLTVTQTGSMSDGLNIQIDVTNLGAEPTTFGLAADLEFVGIFEQLWDMDPIFRAQADPGVTTGSQALAWPGTTMIIYRDIDTSPVEVGRYTFAGVHVRTELDLGSSVIEFGPDAAWSHSPVVAGGGVRLDGAFFAPGAVELYLDPNPAATLSDIGFTFTPSTDVVSIGTALVGGDGTVSIYATVPAGTLLGEYYPMFRQNGEWLSYFEEHRVTVVGGTPTTVVPGTVAIEGTIELDQVLSAVDDGWEPGVTVLHQWAASGVDIPGATGPTFTIGQAQLGETLSVTATGWCLDCGPAAVTSEPTDPVSETFLDYSDGDLSIQVKRGGTLGLEVRATNLGTETVHLGLGGDLLALGTVTHLWESPEFGEFFRSELAPGVTSTFDVPFWPGATGTFFRDPDAAPQELASFTLPGEWVRLDLGFGDPTVFEAGPTLTHSDASVVPGEGVLLRMRNVSTVGRVEVWISSDSQLELGGDAVVQTPGSTDRLFGYGYFDGDPDHELAIVGNVPSDFAPSEAQLYLVTQDGPTPHYSSRSLSVVAGSYGPITPGSVEITGRARLDFTVSAATVGWPVGSTLVYQWFADYEAILGASGPTLDVGNSLIGKQLTVEVTAWLPGTPGAGSTSVPTAAVTASSFTDTPPPTILGMPAVGVRLEAIAPVWTPTTGFDYVWYANGAQVAGGSRFYTPTAADLGKTIVVGVTSRRAGFITADAASVQSAPVGVGILTPPANLDLPRIAIAPRVGNTLEVRTGTWRPTSASITAQWTIDGIEIPGATGLSFLVPPELEGIPTVGRQLGAVITVSAPGYQDVVLTRAANGLVTEAVFSPKGTPAILGTLAVGAILTADPGVWDPAASLSYQWEIVNVGVISTDPSIVIPPAAQNRKIRLTVTATAPGYATVVKIVTTATKVP